jgi:hypothetical protein
MRGLGKWASSVQRAGERPRLKAQGKICSSQRKSSLHSNGQVSGLKESAAVYHFRESGPSFGDKSGTGKKDHAVVRNVEILSVAGIDTFRFQQEKEARTVRGIPFQ